MSPEEVASLSSQTRRYGHGLDMDVDQYCPPLIRIKNGNVAKRQPHVRQMGADYWKSQCSFRHLKTSGRVDELKDRIRERDRSKDIVIKQELDRIRGLLNAHYEQQEKEDTERWWQNPLTKLERKIESDAQRALAELLERDPAVRNSVLVIRTSTTALSYWAAKFGLACQNAEPAQSMISVTDDGLSWGSWTVIGGADMVQQQVNKMSEQVELETQREKARQDAAREARRVEKQNRHAALINEARRQDDWDLTGSWSIKCTELATFSDETRARLFMEVFVDDYDLNDVRGPDDQSGDEEDHDEEEVIDQQRPRAAVTSRDTHIPRYCANFNFGVIEGVMRIYPPAASRSNTAPFKISSDSNFEYIWRGRETGESKIQTTADEHVLPITFGDHGTTFEGTFHCEFLRPVRIVGQKVSHGRGRKMSSDEGWRGLSERGWERERRTRWGRW